MREDHQNCCVLYSVPLLYTQQSYDQLLQVGLNYSQFFSVGFVLFLWGLCVFLAHFAWLSWAVSVGIRVEMWLNGSSENLILYIDVKYKNIRASYQCVIWAGQKGSVAELATAQAGKTRNGVVCVMRTGKPSMTRSLTHYYRQQKHLMSGYARPRGPSMFMSVKRSIMRWSTNELIVQMQLSRFV